MRKLLDIEVVLLVPKSLGTGGDIQRCDSRFADMQTRHALSSQENATTLVNEDGTGHNGWVSNDHARYFIDGHALTGFQRWHVDGHKFYFDSYGRLLAYQNGMLIGKQSSYLLKVNKTLNCLTVYAKDGNNGYILPVKAMLVGDDTPIGTFYTLKYRWRLMVNDTYTQYATRITQGFLLHSITYEEPDIGTS